MSSQSSSSSWLTSALPQHSIFELPPSSTTELANSSVSELARPISPELSAILPQSTSSRSLFGHASSSSSAGSPTKRSTPSSKLRLGTTTSDGRHRKKEISDPHVPARKSRMCLARGSDLIVAVGTELRIASLADVKARCSDHDNSEQWQQEAALGAYKTLHTPSITFEIQQLILNPTSKLLAVIGVHSVAVVVLPRKGWATSLSRTIECRSLLVGRFYHSLPGSTPVAQALWHPWGDSASSLLVLTSDAVVREYTINDDVEEPSQTVSFLKSKKASGRTGGRGFSAEDEDAEVATSFCVGQGKADWGPLTLYGLMRNGDVLAVCPFLPKKASVPAAYLHALSCFVSTKVDYLAMSTSELQRDDDPNASTSTIHPSTSWLGTPTRSSTLALSVTSATSSASRRRPSPSPLSKLYNLQLQYVNALVRQLSVPSLDSAANADDSMDIDPTLPASSRPVFVRPPPVFTSARAPPVPQGPFLLQPEPAELDNGAESRACDLSHVQYRGVGLKMRGASENDEDDAEDDGIGLLVVAFSDGKVDLCLEVEKVEAKWSSSGKDYDRNLDDDDDEEDAVGPSLLVLESIDLGLADEVGAGDEDRVERALATNWPTLVQDPLYEDSLYVYHALGAHCLMLSRWLEDVVPALASDDTEVDHEGDDGEGGKELERVMRSQQPTDVAWILKTVTSAGADSTTEPSRPVVGCHLVNDVYLGYSILLLTSALQFVGIELSLRVKDNSALASPSPAPAGSSQHSRKQLASDPPPYLSLLDEPFNVPSVLAKRSTVSTVARLAGPAPSSSGGELKITPDTLRYMGKAVETFQSSIRDLVQGADEVQHRLELQMKELSRQLGKIAQLNAMSRGAQSSGGASAIAGAGDLGARLERTQKTQLALLERTDRLLQTLMDRHSPTISTYERKWFDELERLKIEEGKLSTRADRVVARAQDLRPGLEELRRKEMEREMGTGGRAGMGTSAVKREDGKLGALQLTQLEGKLSDEAKLIGEARRKVERLTQALANSNLS